MDTPESQPVEPNSVRIENDVEEDLYHRPQRLVRISSLANILSWVTLAVVGLLVVFFVSATVMSLQSFPGARFTDLIPTLTTAVILIIPGLFLFTVLQAVSESIYILMDIEENTRRK